MENNEKIKELLARSGLTNKDFSEKLGITRNYLHWIINNKIKLKDETFYKYLWNYEKAIKQGFQSTAENNVSPIGNWSGDGNSNI